MTYASTPRHHMITLHHSLGHIRPQFRAPTPTSAPLTTLAKLEHEMSTIVRTGRRSCPSFVLERSRWCVSSIQPKLPKFALITPKRQWMLFTERLPCVMTKKREVGRLKSPNSLHSRARALSYQKKKKRES